PACWAARWACEVQPVSTSLCERKVPRRDREAPKGERIDLERAQAPLGKGRVSRHQKTLLAYYITKAQSPTPQTLKALPPNRKGSNSAVTLTPISTWDECSAAVRPKSRHLLTRSLTLPQSGSCSSIWLPSLCCRDQKPWQNWHFPRRSSRPSCAKSAACSPPLKTQPPLKKLAATGRWANAS